nr:MAG TPA: hypothetical protein [Caudoviricetes sp.]
MNNERFPHTCKIYRETEANPYDDKEPGKTVLYEGKCRSYTRYVTKGTGDVIASVRILAMPLNTREWDVIPFTGDKVIVEVGASTEEGEVVDREPNNFGTDITWRYVRN